MKRSSSSLVAPRKSRRLAGVKPSSRYHLVSLRTNVFGGMAYESVGRVGDGPLPDRYWSLLRRAVGDISVNSDFYDLTNGRFLRHVANPEPNVTHNIFTGVTEVDLTQEPGIMEEDLPIADVYYPAYEEDFLSDPPSGDDISDDGSVTLGDEDTI